MSVLSSADSMMSIATTEAQAAGLVLQPAIMVGFEFKLSTGKPANIDQADQKWREAAGQVEKALNVAMVLQGGAMLDVAVETYQGNDKAFGDLKQAEEVGSAAAVANLAQNGINAGLAYAGRSNGIGVSGGSKDKSPISAVDLDADRDKDHTWNVGGSATYTNKGGSSWTGGAHVKYGDQGVQGAELEGKYKNGNGAYVSWW